MNISFGFPDIRKNLSEARIPLLWILFFCQILPAIGGTVKLSGGLDEGLMTLALIILTILMWAGWLFEEKNKKDETFFAVLTTFLYLLTISSTFYWHNHQDKVTIFDEKTTLNSYLVGHPFQDFTVINKTFSLDYKKHEVLSANDNPVHISMVINGEIFADTDEDYQRIAQDHPKGSKWGINPYIKDNVNIGIQNLAEAMALKEFSDNEVIERTLKQQLLTLSKLRLRNVTVGISKIEINLSKIVYKF